MPAAETDAGQLLGPPVPFPTALSLVGKSREYSVGAAGDGCTLGSRCLILPYGTANTLQILWRGEEKKKRQLISSTVFIAQRLLGGLMAWTNARLPLIGLFSLPERFSGGSLVYADMKLTFLELLVISQTDLCCY